MGDYLVHIVHSAHEPCCCPNSAAMAGLPGVVVVDRSDLTSPEVRRNVEGFMAGRKADVIMRLGCHCKRFIRQYYYSSHQQSQ